MSNVYPSIPDPTATVESLAESVRSLKMAVELLTGQRTGGTAAHTFTQETTPTALETGDLWIVPSTGSVNYWNGSSWMLLNPATTTTSVVAASQTTSASSIQAFSAWASAGQSISANWVKLQCDVVEFDTDSRYNSKNYRFNPSVAGLYLFTVGMNLTSQPSAIFATAVYKNGKAARWQSYGYYLYGPTGASMVWMNGTTDYVEPYVYSSGAATTYPGAEYTYFQGCLLRAD